MLGTFPSTDKRGKHLSHHNTIPDDIIEGIRKHIKSFPRIESHYCSKTTKKQYPAQDLNIHKMGTLCKQERDSKNEPQVKESKYREIFCTEFNLSFFEPKKDQCSLCTLYSTQKDPDEILVKKYEERQLRKKHAREEKTKDKRKSKNDPGAATIDL